MAESQQESASERASAKAELLRALSEDSASAAPMYEAGRARPSLAALSRTPGLVFANTEGSLDNPSEEHDLNPADRGHLAQGRQTCGLQPSMTAHAKRAPREGSMLTTASSCPHMSPPP